MAHKDVHSELRNVLLQRRQALIMSLRGENSLLNEMAQKASGDEMDFALDSTQDEIYSRLAEAESRELAHILYALEKMNEGSYGKCESCECQIPKARLLALPFSTLCVDCKRKVETGIINIPAGNNWSQIDDRKPLDGVRLSEMDFNG